MRFYHIFFTYHPPRSHHPGKYWDFGVPSPDRCQIARRQHHRCRMLGDLPWPHEYLQLFHWCGRVEGEGPGPTVDLEHVSLSEEVG